MTEHKETNEESDEIELGFAIPGTDEYIPWEEIVKDAVYIVKHPEDADKVAEEYPKYVSIHLAIPRRITFLALGICFFLGALAYFLTR